MRYQVVNPATGQVEREYPTATDAEIGAVLDRAGRAYPSWRRTPRAERADILRRVAQLYEDRAAELGAIITREMGKTTAEAAGELEFTVGIYRYYADNAADLLKDAPLQSNTPGSAWVRKSPIGALLGIMPWNYPYYQVARFAAPEPDDRQHDRPQARTAVPGVVRLRSGHGQLHDQFALEKARHGKEHVAMFRCRSEPRCEWQSQKVFALVHNLDRITTRRCHRLHGSAVERRSGAKFDAPQWDGQGSFLAEAVDLEFRVELGRFSQHLALIIGRDQHCAVHTARAAPAQPVQAL